MRLKYYLRGLGLGIIFAVIIMMVGYRNHGSSMSDSQIIEKAKTLGMVETENSSEMKTDNKTDNKTDEKIDTSESDTSTADTSTDEDTQTGTDNTDADNTDGTAAADTTAPADAAATDTTASDTAGTDAAQPQQNTTFTITVAGGDTCRMIAERLQAAGIIDDAEKFRVYMGQKGVDQFIADGSHEIPYGASYDDIINILTQK